MKEISRMLRATRALTIVTRPSTFMRTLPTRTRIVGTRVATTFNTPITATLRAVWLEIAKPTMAQITYRTVAIMGQISSRTRPTTPIM